MYLMITGYVKLYHEFMSMQPVFHTYDLHRWIMKDHIIDTLPPAKNKFCDFANVTVCILGITMTSDEVRDAIPLAEFADLIDTHYLSADGWRYTVKPSHIATHIIGHKHDTFVTWYKDKSSGKIIGTMTTRPIFLTIRGEKHVVAYTDHLCVHSERRRSNIAAKMIQTSVYVKRHDRPERMIAMFKREGAQTTGVVPVLTYETTMHRMNMMQHNLPALPPRKRLFRIPTMSDKQVSNSVIQGAFVDFMEFMNSERKKFTMFAIPYKTNVWELIAEGILIPIIVYDESVLPPKVVAVYVYKNSSVAHSGEDYVELMASVADTTTRVARANHATFFVHTLNMINDEFGGIFVEATSDTVHLLEFIRHTSDLSLQSVQTNEFVMFNYAAYPISGENALLIGV